MHSSTDQVDTDLLAQIDYSVLLRESPRPSSPMSCSTSAVVLILGGPVLLLAVQSSRS
jgi:hypothetical protein